MRPPAKGTAPTRIGALRGPSQAQPGLMHQADEIELKWCLQAEGHAVLAVRLAETFGPGRPLDQENRFYDTIDGRLRQRRVNLRLRRENGIWILTCKQRVLAADGLHHHREWETSLGTPAGDPLDTALAQDLPAPLRETLAGERPICLGGFSNTRLAWDAEGEHICLDRTTFRKRTDHELEVETAQAEASRLRWEQRLGAWGVAHQPSLTTKFARFLADREASQRTS